MHDFWPDCGYQLLERGTDGQLIVTDDYLRLYYRRPELAPVAESCAAELALYQSLLDAPRRLVSDADIDRLADADARDNYRVMLRFRARLLASSSLQAFYFNLFREDVAVPPDFIHHTAQVILRGLLDGTENGLEARAAELFFRTQRVSINDGAVMLADAETVERHAVDSGLGNIGRMLRDAQAPVRSAELDVLDEESHSRYFERAGQRDTVLHVNPGTPGSHAICRLIERWVAHFHGVDVGVTPLREIPDDEWRWHAGLDAEASAMLNELYNGGEVDEDRMKRIIGLFRMEFRDATALRAEVSGCPVFLAMAMTPTGWLRMKPQNLLMNLPLAERA
jgi:hypothetical protein